MTLRPTLTLLPLAAFLLGALPGLAAQAQDVSTGTTPVPVETTLPTPSSSEVAAAIGALPEAPDWTAEKAATVMATQIVFAKHAAGTAVPAASKAKAPKAEAPAPSSPESMQAAAHRLKLPLPLPAGHIVIKKAQRRLEVWSGATKVKTYRVALGRTPSGHKVQQGDGRTPEGEFFICTRNASTSAFHIFLGLSYPALPDAQRGLKTKAISQREFLAIRNRLASRSVPLWRTRLGGWVGIHGGTGEAFARKQSAARHSPDWTAGCIALTNREIEEIYAATKLGTPVSVRP